MNCESSFLSKIFTQTYSRQKFLDGLVAQLRVSTGVECVGIRIVKPDGVIPYESYAGFSRDFWRAENCLFLREDQCVCTRR